MQFGLMPMSTDENTKRVFIIIKNRDYNKQYGVRNSRNPKYKPSKP